MSDGRLHLDRFNGPFLVSLLLKVTKRKEIIGGIVSVDLVVVAKQYTIAAKVWEIDEYE